MREQCKKMIGEKDLIITNKSPKEYNKASGRLNSMEDLLIKNSQVTELDMDKKKYELSVECNGLKTVKDQDDYLDKLTIYIANLMKKYDVGMGGFD
jgi:hypothetical protein